MPGHAFYEALAWRESRNDQHCVNQFGFMGLYQMGMEALQDVGYVNSSHAWTGKNGIFSLQNFLDSRHEQNHAIREYHRLVWNNYLGSDVRGAVGRNIGGVNVTVSGIIAGAHLVGCDGVSEFIRTNGRVDREDEIGTHCSEYMTQFGVYD